MYESVAKLPCGEVTVAKLPYGEVTGNHFWKANGPKQRYPMKEPITTNPQLSYR